MVLNKGLSKDNNHALQNSERFSLKEEKKKDMV